MARDLVIEIEVASDVAQRRLAEFEQALHRVEKQGDRSKDALDELEVAEKNLLRAISSTQRAVEAKERADIRARLEAEKTTIGARAATAVQNILTSAIVRYASAAAIGAAIVKTIEYGGRLDDMSKRTGIGSEMLQRLGDAAGQSGATLEQVTSAIGRMSDRLGSGDRAAVGAVRALGLSLETIRRQDPGKTFADLAQAIASVEDPYRRAALATDLFGRGGQELLSLLLEMSKALGEDIPVMSDRSVAALARVDDSWARLKHTATTALGNLLGEMFSFADQVSSWATRVNTSMLGMLRPTLDLLRGDFMSAGFQFRGALRDFSGDVGRLPGVRPPGAQTGGGLGPLPMPDEVASAIETSLTNAVKRSQEAHQLMAKSAEEAAQRSLRAYQAWLTGVQQLAQAQVLAAQQAAGLMNNPFSLRTTAPILSLPRSDGSQLVLGTTSVPWQPTLTMQGSIDRSNWFMGTAPSLQGQNVSGPGGIAPSQQPSFLSRAVSGTSLANAALGALTGGGSVAQAIGGAAGGGIAGQAVSGVAKAIGGTIGATLGSVVPVVGTILGGMVGKWIGGLFGPSEQEKVKQMREQWLASVEDIGALEDAARLAGFEMSKLYDARRVKDFEQAQRELESALKHWQQQLEDIKLAADGLNLRVEAWGTGIVEATDQGAAGFERMGGFAVAVFANMAAHTGDLIGALNAVGPALDTLIEKQDAFGFAATASVQGLLDLRRFVKEQPEIAASIQGLTQMVKGLADAGWLSAGTFKAFGEDAVELFNQMVDRGLPAEQALMALQPVLQELWEAQQKFGFATDEATQELIDMGMAHGVVGEAFKSAADQMVNLLSGIKDAITDLKDGLLGLGRVRVPEIRIPYRYTQEGDGLPVDATFAARGGYVTASGVQYFAAGGNVVRLVPRGSDTVPAMLTPGEVVVSRQDVLRAGGPVGVMHRVRGGGVGSVHVTINHPQVDSERRVRELAEEVVEQIRREAFRRERFAQAS